jgi:hypothetical protein
MQLYPCADIDRVTKEILECFLKVIEQSKIGQPASIRLDIDQEINIAVGACFPACNRANHTDVVRVVFGSHAQDLVASCPQISESNGIAACHR